MGDDTSGNAGPIPVYCQARRDLEEQVWFLGDRLHVLSRQLMSNIGESSRFLEIKAECERMRKGLAESRFSVASHRREHGC
jgi:hypothetical protein